MENKKEILEKLKKVFVKIGKRNLIIALSLVLIGTAVLLNWKFFAGKGDKQIADDVVNENENSEVVQVEDYFASAALSRQRARDEAIEVFQMVADSTTALDESKVAALNGINQIAMNIEIEANIESLVESKGFAECVAVINGDCADVVVKSDELMDNELVQIQEIVYEQAGIVPSNVKITLR